MINYQLMYIFKWQKNKTVKYIAKILTIVKSESKININKKI